MNLPANPEVLQATEPVHVQVGSSYNLNEPVDQDKQWSDRRCADESLRRLRWFPALCEGLDYQPYLLEARQAGRLVGTLPLAYVESLLFGKFLVSLPYVSSAGVVAESEDAGRELIDRAVRLSDELDVRYLELRHEVERTHPALNQQWNSKVHMRLELPGCEDAMWKQLKPKVRNQIRKSEKQDLAIEWGGHELIDDFYAVFSMNMRDLGTPVFGQRLFEKILDAFPGDAEICSVRLDGRPVAAALAVHNGQTTEVPSASSLRQFNYTNANMLMYWHLLRRAIRTGSEVFDFGRSSENSSTYRFKKQWGARPVPAVWQYYVRKGHVDDMRRDNSRYNALIGMWQKLPVKLTRLIGPRIVRGIP